MEGYREKKIVPDNDAGECSDTNSEEYITMGELEEEVYEEIPRQASKGRGSVRDGVTSHSPLQKESKIKNKVYYDCNDAKIEIWNWLSRNYLVLSAVIYLCLLVFVLILVAVALASINSMESNLIASCGQLQNFTKPKLLDSLSEFTVASQQRLTRHCKLERSNFNKYQTLNIDFTSCSDILYQNSSAESGYYLLRSSTGQLTSVYCDMTRSCGNITGGWMRLAELDVTSCPAGLKSKIFEGIRTCVVNEDAPGCTSVLFGSYGISFSKICGQIRGYGLGTVDGIYRLRYSRGSNLNDNYIDGVSLTIGETHVWSFAAADCECSYTKPFITDDWTCDGQLCLESYFCGNYLWNNTICGQSTPFLKHLPNTTTNDIKMRVCRDEPRENEDIALSNIELYVY